MRLFRSDPETNLGSYILDELRELRKGQEGNNVEFRGEFASIRDTITTLSEGVKVTQSQSGVLRSDIDDMESRLTSVEHHVSDIKQSNQIMEATKSSSWDGPKKIMAFIAAVAAFFTFVVVTSKGWPILVSLMSATVD